MLMIVVYLEKGSGGRRGGMVLCRWGVVSGGGLWIEGWGGCGGGNGVLFRFGRKGRIECEPCLFDVWCEDERDRP